jgi:hypothetical protein
MQRVAHLAHGGKPASNNIVGEASSWMSGVGDGLNWSAQQLPFEPGSARLAIVFFGPLITRPDWAAPLGSSRIVMASSGGLQTPSG